MKKLSLVIMGAALGFGTMALAGGASAAALQPFQPLAASQSNGDGNIQLAASRQERMRDRWDRKRDGQRCSKRFGNCRHYHRGHYYETPWWTLPLIIGGSIAAQNNYDGGGYGSRHVEWCSERYRSYNPRNNTWVAYSGNVNQCNSPYG
ncbi:MAG: BA14K family protein [Aestuariivirga sp.]